jgi:hypothetical protein
VFLLHQKALAQSAMRAKLFLANGSVVIRQPPYSFDLVATYIFPLPR